MKDGRDLELEILQSDWDDRKYFLEQYPLNFSVHYLEGLLKYR